MTHPNSIQIHLRAPARQQAARALYPVPACPYTTPLKVTEYADKHAAALAAQDAFTGPDFKGGVRQGRIAEGFLIVELENGTVYSYPVGDIARIKSYHTPALPVVDMEPAGNRKGL